MSNQALSSSALSYRAISWVVWAGIAALGAFAFAGIALNRNEPVSAAWLVTAAICVYLIAYRFYSKFIATKVLQLDDTRLTPAERHNDGLDYVPTNKYVVFGHHFAAIAGAGPLVGPVLAAQMGYLPGTLWILVGVVFAGAVQDFIILFCSIRRDGRSLGEMVKMEMGPVAGGVALVGTLGIMIIILAALGAGRREGAGRKPVGNLHGRDHHSDRHAHGRLHAQHPARQGRGGLRVRRRRVACSRSGTANTLRRAPRSGPPSPTARPRWRGPSSSTAPSRPCCRFGSCSRRATT